MSYKNSVKLLTSNFSIVWKQMLYMLVVCILVFASTYGICQPIIHTLKNEGVLSELSKTFKTIYTAPKDFAEQFTTAFKDLGNVLSANFSKLWLSMFFSAFMLVFVYSFLKGVSLYNISSLMFYKMTSFTDIGYTRNMISSLGSSTRYSLARFVLKIPFAFLKALILFTFFQFANSALSVLIGLFATILFLVLISSLELTLFTSMASKMLEDGGSAFKAFFKGNLTTFKKLPRIFSNSIIVVLTIIFINAFLGIFTLSVALLITIPASMVFMCIYSIASYLGAKGGRYYISKNVIAVPMLGEENKIEH